MQCPRSFIRSSLLSARLQCLAPFRRPSSVSDSAGGVSGETETSRLFPIIDVFPIPKSRLTGSLRLELRTAGRRQLLSRYSLPSTACLSRSVVRLCPCVVGCGRHAYPPAVWPHGGRPAAIAAPKNPAGPTEVEPMDGSPVDRRATPGSSHLWENSDGARNASLMASIRSSNYLSAADTGDG